MIDGLLLFFYFLFFCRSKSNLGPDEEVEEEEGEATVPHQESNCSRPKEQREQPEKQPRCKKLKTGLGEAMDERLLKIIEDPPAKPHVPQDEDEMFHFAMSIVPMLNRLPLRARRKARIDIITLIDSMQAQVEQLQDAHQASSASHSGWTGHWQTRPQSQSSPSGSIYSMDLSNRRSYTNMH